MARIARSCGPPPASVSTCSGWIGGREIRPRTLRRLVSSHQRADALVQPGRHDEPQPHVGLLPRLHPDIRLSRHHEVHNVAELARSARATWSSWDKGFDPIVHRPIELTVSDRERFACDVGFVGYFEEDRARMMLRLAESGIPVAVHGPRWSHLAHAHPNLIIRGGYLDGDDYAKAICATRINLGFLRKSARDLRRREAVEIPACAGFMLAERTTSTVGSSRRVWRPRYSRLRGAAREMRYYLGHERNGPRSRQRGAGVAWRHYDNAARLTAVLEQLGSREESVRRGDGYERRRRGCAQISVSSRR